MTRSNLHLKDINKFPQKSGMFVFGISMSRINNTQSATHCMQYIEHFIPKILFPRVGLTFLYGDSLYMNSSEPAIALKTKFHNLCAQHKFEFKKMLSRNPILIANSFSYITWNQMLLESKDFIHFFGKLKQYFNKDKDFQEFVRHDIRSQNRRYSQNNIKFVLEEILAFYLISKGKIQFYNEFVLGHEKWTLICYPGKPLRSEIYLFQKNIFKLNNPTNVYENSYYDLEDKKLYNYLDILL